MRATNAPVIAPIAPSASCCIRDSVLAKCARDAGIKSTDQPEQRTQRPWIQKQEQNHEEKPYTASEPLPLVPMTQAGNSTQKNCYHRSPRNIVAKPGSGR